MLGYWIPTLVLFVAIGAQAQENVTAEVPAVETKPSGRQSTRISLDVISATAAPPVKLNFNSYSFKVEQDFGERVTLIGQLPLLMGKTENREFNEIGNVFLGANLQALELQDYHPLWLSLHGGVRFSRPEETTVAAARYQEIHTGLALTKYFDSVAVITSGTYIQKGSEAVSGLDVGNEVNGFGGLSIKLNEDWSTQAGYLVRHADPLRFYDQVVAEEDLYTALELQLTFRLNALVSVNARTSIPLMSQEAYGPHQASFGDLSTQASLGRSWAFGVNVGM